MKITVESTSKTVEFIVNGVSVPARMWQGETENGIPVLCFITRIVPEVPIDDPRHDEMAAQFDRELRRVAAPRPAIEVFPAKLIL
jgi:hypothetical protein